MIAWLAGKAAAATLEGQVVDEQGAPVVAAAVVAYDLRLQYTYVYTDEGGRFVLDEPIAGPVRVRVLPSAYHALEEQWYPVGVEVCGGELLDSPPPLTVTLREAGALHGQILAADGEPVPGAELRARSVRAGTTVATRSTTADANGRFYLRGLPIDDGVSGSFRVEVTSPGAPRQFFGGVYEASGAESFTVGRGENQDVGARTLREGVSVGGAVWPTDASTPLGVVTVYAGGQFTDADVIDGRYRADPLPPGEVRAWSTLEGLALTYAPDLDRPGGARSLASDGDVANDLDLFPPPAVPFPLMLHGGRSPLADIAVVAYNDDRTVGLGGLSAPDGAVDIEGLRPGRYQVYAYGASSGFLDDWVRDDNGAVQWFELPTAEAFDVPLVAGGSLSGTVTQRRTGRPVYGAEVMLTSADRPDDARVSTTDVDGHYVARGLPAGAWKVEARYRPLCHADPGYTTVYWPDTDNPMLGGGVTVAGGSEATWDVALGPDDDHDAMDDDWERDVGLDPDVADGGSDDDGDRYSNVEEYRLGTDPTAAPLPAPACGCATGGPEDLLLAAVIGVLAARRRDGRRVPA